MATILRNVRTHEVRTVEPESDEYFDLIGEVFDPGDGTAKPAWEQQGYHSAEPPAEGIEGTDSLQASGPELEPHKQLTAGEREVGLEDWDQKAKELAENKAEPGEPLKTPADVKGKGKSRAPRTTAPAGRKAEGEKVELNQTQGEPTTPAVP